MICQQALVNYQLNKILSRSVFFAKMETCTHVFQISGIKIRDEKRVLIQGIQQLGGKYIGGSVYQNACTHLIIPQVLSSEKFLAACAAGKWVVTPDYVLDSVKNGSWLTEEPYEVAISTGSSAAFYPVKQWREKVASGRLKGAFQGWRVLLMVQGSTRRAMFKRLLKAGRAEVYHCPPPSYASITHVMAKPVTESSKSHSAPCYPVSHIVQHLFGTESLLFGGQSNRVDMNFNITEEQEAHPADVKENFSTLEAELKTYIKQVGQPRLCFLEYLGYHDPYSPLAQATKMDFSNVGCMIECGLFTEALDSIRSGVYPGLLPPAPHLISLLEYAQQGNATSVFMRNFQQVLDKLLITNPPWMAPKSVKQYFTQVLQCPRCKKGLWSFLETAIRYSMSSEETCHALPGPGLPTLLHFHCYILTLFLKIFQGELHSVTAGEFVQLQGAPPASASGSLLYRTFWTVWERSTLLSSAVKQLMQLLIQAAMTEYAERDEKQKLHLADTLLDFLSVLVEFWYQQHFKLNQTLVDKGLKDLSEYLAVISQDLSPNILVELVIRVRSTRLKLMVADAIFRNLCCRNGCTMGDEPLSLKKMVLFYLPALGSLALSPSGTRLRTEPSSHSCTSQGTDCRPQNSLENETCSEKENIPRGLNRVNAAGSVLLRQTDGHGRVPLDLVSEPSQREELLHSAQLGDTKCLRNKATEVNLPLLEAGSSLLSLLIFSYLRETGIPHHTPTSDKHHSLGYRLVRALERHSFQKVTQGWADQRAVRLVEDVETLWELSQGKYQGQVSQGVVECKGENTQFLMKILEDLRSRGEALVGDL
ncbi:SMC5-SMC6 complex localization factor protein 1 isoform X5 [Simochromis diagramma]|uniref:SMC5-SMC6 complex localization factor protein 1 isoform X5 n=1 Tax=Simochromis diagramma TaxID=43689 RepID=UPI001A7E9AD1|nr:SMC5-SMC6 complex localization factor protein 1 isoform X5 [Simochromis diagramma]